MGIRHLPEKADLLRRRRDGTTRPSGHGALVAFQHILLWCSAYIAASEIYMWVTGAVTTELLPSAILLLVSVREPRAPLPTRRAR